MGRCGVHGEVRSTWGGEEYMGRCGVHGEVCHLKIQVQCTTHEDHIISMVTRTITHLQQEVEEHSSPSKEGEGSHSRHGRCGPQHEGTGLRESRQYEAGSNIAHRPTNQLHC